MKNDTKYHESVMIDETLTGLDVKKDLKYIDATAGNGGHIERILEIGAKVIGIDMDPEMIAISEKRLETLSGFKLIQGNFTNIDKIAKDAGWVPVNGVLFDLGVSNIHLKDLERGFSFGNPDAQLDMRIDKEGQGVKASDLLNVLREDQLRNLFEVTLDSGSAKWITGRVLHSRAAKPVATVGDMLEICQGLKTAKLRLNEATLPFLALRIAVNSELDNLKSALPKAFEILTKGGRLVVISFHSKEDEIVKDFFKEKSLEGAKLITFKPIMAGEGETGINKRARSAKMRVLEK
ncbi:MAG TPA: 16S rRNA (cytosine(1402)-N(4))-methyltransferase RsmH [Patescibacteria group bacterium]|nr:16S rRNA (cytosine(1402)-N(4))-methyltransferase RsmH [Patescibacteria group bacterium]